MPEMCSKKSMRSWISSGLGPLTLLLPKQPAVPSIVTAGRELVGVRMPAHPVALALIAAANLPIAAPSANRFGHISPTTAQHVLEDLDGRIDLLLDSGPAWCGVESTVIEVRDHQTILYRPGAIPAEEIESIAGPVILYRPADDRGDEATPPESLPSPGVDMRHYAPNARVIPLEISEHTANERQQRWLDAVQEQCNIAQKIGVLLPSAWPLPQEVLAAFILPGVAGRMIRNWRSDYSPDYEPWMPWERMSFYVRCRPILAWGRPFAIAC